MQRAQSLRRAHRLSTDPSSAFLFPTHTRWCRARVSATFIRSGESVKPAPEDLINHNAEVIRAIMPDDSPYLLRGP